MQMLLCYVVTQGCFDRREGDGKKITFFNPEQV